MYMYKSFYGYNYMKNLIRDNQCLAKSFNYTVRYIDDLLTFNNSKFETEITTLRRTTESATLLSYLDMTVYVNHNRFSTTLYDKRDSFSFDIVNSPHMSSNIPSNPMVFIYEHIHKGICLPLVAKNTLTRNIHSRHTYHVTLAAACSYSTAVIIQTSSL